MCLGEYFLVDANEVPEIQQQIRNRPAFAVRSGPRR